MTSSLASEEVENNAAKQAAGIWQRDMNHQGSRGGKGVLAVRTTTLLVRSKMMGRPTYVP